MIASQYRKFFISFIVVIMVHLSLFYFMPLETEEKKFVISDSSLQIQLMAEPKVENRKKKPIKKIKNKSIKKNKVVEEIAQVKAIKAPESEVVETISNLNFEKQIVANKKPIYPRISRLKSEEGDVKLQLLVDKSGQVLKLRVLKASPFKSLNKAAKKAAQKWRFKKHPKSYQVEKTIKFRLQE